VVYLHTDHLGAVVKATDGDQGLVWDAERRPFGERRVTTALVGVALGFPGQYFDEESGNYYNYFMDYDPGTGRYLQSDPIGLKGGLNTYLYANANPLSWVDPDGQVAGAVMAGGLLGGLGVGAIIIYNQNSVDWQDIGPAFGDPERTADYNRYNNRCNEKEPDFFRDDCERWKWKLRQRQDCLRYRQQFDRRYSRNRHGDAIANMKEAVRKAKRNVKTFCKPRCENFPK
jgi:RHS repeat-associated protein